MTKKLKTEGTAAGMTANAGESVYSAKELAENAERVFGPDVRSECAAAALRMANKDSAGLEEAKQIVEAFMKREVR